MSARAVRRFWLLLLWMAAPAAAQVASPGPEKVAVTIYRAPDRGADQPMNGGWLRGYALVTEQRTIAIPAGRTTIRFEGVAAGILPESAIVAGLPDGVREKNLDADLLAPASLYAFSYGRPVTIRRMAGKRLVEEDGIIRSGPEGAAIIETKDGFQAVQCNAGPGAIVYHGVPPALPARPTLSIALDSPVARTATVTLSYLAWGFDWQANYVATLRPGGASADLLAWVTLASSDTTSFADAEAAVVAGKPNREDQAPWSDERAGAPLELHCLADPLAYDVPPPPPPAPMAKMMESASDIVVTAQRAAAPRAKMVVQEELGDLKLYRVPDRTTVAALAQKQVALLDREAVPIDVLYRVTLSDGEAGPVRIVLRALNRKDRGLGVPLPAGKIAVFEPHGAAPLLLGEGSVADKAVGEEVEIDIAGANQVTAELTNIVAGKWRDHALTVRNANVRPVAFEAVFDLPPGGIDSPSVRLVRREGRMRMPVTVPANGTTTLRYRIRGDN